MIDSAMTKQEFLASLKPTYSLVKAIKSNENYHVYRFRNVKQNKDIIIRYYQTPQAAYEELCPISCENLPLIYDVIPLDDGQIVLEEYIEGLTIADAMECEKYRYKGAKQVIRAVCNALSVLHRRGIIHRDVKPENVIIDKNGRVVLIDFNAARKVTNAGKDTVVMGTVGYASPEQLGLRESDPRTDIYALGVMLNVMLTGKHPSEKIAKGRAGRVVRKCTNVNPDERYASAEKLARAL